MVGNLKTDVYSEMPGVVAPFVRGPWPSEVAPFHFDDLFTGADVAQYWDNLETTATEGVAKLVDLVKKNKCSASGCPGHAQNTDTCHFWNDPAAELFHERKKLLLLLIGTILHAVQDFYSHSNWVEQWDAARKGGDIPTWDDAKAAADQQSQGIMNGTHTGAWGAKNPPAGSQHHDALNNDSAKSPQGASSPATAKPASTNWPSRRPRRRQSSGWTS